MLEAHVAIVFRVKTRSGPRYFSGFGKAGRVQSAWSLPGAVAFGPWDTHRLDTVEQKLSANGCEPARIRVGIMPAEGVEP